MINLRRCVALAVLLVTLVAAGSAGATEGDVGYRGPSAAGIDNSAPTGAKPESRMWWNDGAWWSLLHDEAGGGHRIWRLDAGSQNWTNTGVSVDDRSQSRGDALWDGTHLYVASHIFVNNGGGVEAGKEARLYRFSYDTVADTYSLDAGFPVQVSPSKSEALVLDKDSTGRLWVTWVQGGQVWVNRTVGDDLTWGTPFGLPFPAASNLYFDDLSSAIAFGGNRIGVMWSHQNDDAFYFAEHVDGQADDVWTLQTALQGLDIADDHINLKADSAGRVYAAVKTSLTTSSAPLTYLLVRDPSTSVWASHVIGTVGDHHTRPIVTLNEEAGTIDVFATSPEAGGSIYRKTSPMDSISFPPGKGTVFIRDAASADMNDASSSKQTVSSATGLAVLASNDTTDFYWHNFDSLVLGADFTAARTSGGVPFTVAFTDTSTGSSTSWSWDFGDGTTSTERNPRHMYENPGSYTVTLTIASPRGLSSTEQKAAYVNATPSVVFTPTDDSWVRSSTPDSNFSAQTVLNVKANGLTDAYENTYLRFAVTGMTATVIDARLRLWVTDGSKDGGTAYAVGTDWTESALTWNTAPALAGDSLWAVGTAAAGTWVEIPLPASMFAAGNGVHAFGIRNADNDTVTYASSESAHPPQLLLGVPPPPVAAFQASPTSGAAPVAATFADLSTGEVTSWSWDFGDGTTSSERNPTHTYSTPGAHTVKLAVSGPGGTDVETKATYVTVTPPPPTAAFSATPMTGFAPLTVAFTDLSTDSPTSWNWDFGDGGASTERNPMHIYAAPGTYTVTLTAANGWGSDAETKTGHVTATLAPDFALTVSPTTAAPKPGQSKSYTATISPNATFSGQVTLSVTGVPPNTTATFSPNLLLVSTLPASSTLRVATKTSTPTGVYSLAITARSGAIVRTQTIQLDIRGGKPNAASGKSSRKR